MKLFIGDIYCQFMMINLELLGSYIISFWDFTVFE